MIDNFEPSAKKVKSETAEELKYAVENEDFETVKKINALFAEYRKAFFGR